MTTALTLLSVLGLLGAFDTLYYHEWKLRLPSRPHARQELALHASRDFVYALLFGTIAWLDWNGALAWLCGALLLAEIALTLADFIEEDRTRKLPPGERAGHAIWGWPEVFRTLYCGIRLPTVRVRPHPANTPAVRCR